MESNIINEALDILRCLTSHQSLGEYVDSEYGLPKLHEGSGRIKLIILGQDPTVKNEKSRGLIRTVLNLDKHGRLYVYLSSICNGLGFDLDTNVYATNYFKNFFVRPPTQIKEINIFQEFEPYWLPLLKEEIEQFPNIPILSLGQPLLRMIVQPGASGDVRDYWGYTKGWKSGERGIYKYLHPELNKTGRIVFPFPHLPSANKHFYYERFDDYISFTKHCL